MKIKTWLLLSYLIVMILPLIAAYFLFAWINSFNNDLEVGEYLKTSVQLQEVRSVLEDPALYQPAGNVQNVKQIANDQMFVTLYDDQGLVIYTSNPINIERKILQKSLYKNLYDINQGYRVYKYKQPVFDQQQIVGFFEVEIARDEWTAGVSNRSLLTLGVFATFFIFIYIGIIWAVNRKLNKRLTGLMVKMDTFASGKKVQQTKERNDEIGALTKQFYEMAQQITDAQELITQEQQEKEHMIASISHDLKTPLTSIKAYAESLGEEVDLTEAEKIEYRQVIIEKSDFMKQMLDDLLTFTLLQSPTYEIDLVPVDGSEFFEMLISGYEPLCQQKDLNLYTSSNGLGMYFVNPKQLIRVTDNLVSNAIQHTDEGSQIWIVAGSDQVVVKENLFDFIDYRFDFSKYGYLIVQNEGKGIPANYLQTIFEPLFQMDQARSKKDAHGTGLGLSITKKIIEQHDGSVQIFSKQNIGTTVICSLPKMNSEDEDYEQN